MYICLFEKVYPKRCFSEYIVWFLSNFSYYFLTECLKIVCLLLHFLISVTGTKNIKNYLNSQMQQKLY